MNEKNANQCPTYKDVENADKDVVRFYYQQAIEMFNFFHEKNKSIRNKSGLLLTFLCSAVGFCVKCFIDVDKSYSYIFLITAMCFFGISLFTCFKIFLTKETTSPFYPVQENDNQIGIYKNSLNDVLTTIINKHTKEAIAHEEQKNNKLSDDFNLVVKLTIFVPLFSIILYLFIF